jgi:hypothetical protein
LVSTESGANNTNIEVVLHAPGLSIRLPLFCETPSLLAAHLL